MQGRCRDELSYGSDALENENTMKVKTNETLGNKKKQILEVKAFENRQMLHEVHYKSNLTSQ